MINTKYLIPLLLVSSAAIADSQTGSIDASDQTWDRPSATGATITGSCGATANDSLNNAVAYELFYVRAATFTAPLDITVTSLEATPLDLDPFIAVYCTSFDPAQPTLNLLDIDDDSAGYPNASVFGTAILDPDSVYAIVVSSYSNHPQSQFGTFEIILGPNLFFSTACLPDFSGDGILNFFDISAFLALFTSSNPAADLNHDGFFNFFDVSQFLATYSAGCP